MLHFIQSHIIQLSVTSFCPSAVKSGIIVAISSSYSSSSNSKQFIFQFLALSIRSLTFRVLKKLHHDLFVLPLLFQQNRSDC